MPYFKYLSTLTLCVALNAGANDVTREILHGSEAQKAYMQQLNQSGILEQYSDDNTAKKVEPYKEVAKQISNNSLANLAVSLNKYMGLSQDEASLFAGTAGTNETPETLTGIFVSFSMSAHEIRQAMLEAQEQGAELYFIGMHPSDQHIGDTMKRFRQMMASTDTVANVRFHPKAFEEFGITAVPAVLHAQKGSVGLIHGLMNIDHLKRQMKDTTGFNDFGFHGPTKPVIERNLLEEIQERVAQLDGEALKKQAVDNFWKKRPFTRLPSASKSEEFYINPTVKVTKDIVNPNGDVLARAGDTLNPLDTLPAQNTYVLFNARDIQQLQWVDAHLAEAKYTGIIMLMTSELDTLDGWEHLSALRKHFMQEIYLIPKELVERFTITGLPAVVSTDNKKKLIRINQYAIKELNL